MKKGGKVRRIIPIYIIVLVLLISCYPENDIPINKTDDISQATLTVIRGKRTEEIENNKKIAAKIINTLDAYQKDKNVYPNKLSDLVPLYMSELPKTMYDQGFEYRIKGESYELVFKLVNSLDSHGKYCTYISRLEFWDCDYGSGNDH